MRRDTTNGLGRRRRAMRGGPLWRNTIFSRPLAIEPLEVRRLLSVSMNAQGWTAVDPSADTRTVYLSNSLGNDNNDGLSPSSPVRTLARGQSLVRNGMPDWLLLKKGDVWTGESFANWTASGRSQQEPILISTYDIGPRPLIQLYGWQDGLTVIEGTSHVAIIGLHFSSGARGVRYRDSSLAPHENLLIEDAVFEDFATVGIDIQDKSGPPFEGLKVRRSVIADNANLGSYLNGVGSFLFEENIFDHNGWTGDDRTSGGASVFKRSLYVDNENPLSSGGNTGNETNNMIVRGNIFARDSSGPQLRPGGTFEDNLVVEANYAQFGGGSGNESITTPDGIDVDIRRNVILDAVEVTPDSGMARGLLLANIRNAHIEDNVVARTSSTFFNGISHEPSRHATPELSLIENIFFDVPWGAVRDRGDAVVVAEEQNIYSDAASILDPAWPVTGSNRHAEETVFVDPNRGVQSYNATLGGSPNLEEFLLDARLQSRDNWRGEYTAYAVNDYIRDGFIEADSPPQVASVKVGSTEWTDSFRERVDPSEAVGYPVDTGSNQLATLPWSNINQVFIRFSEDVSRGLSRLGSSGIRLTGVQVPDYAPLISDVSYDAVTNTAQITLKFFIGIEQLMIVVDSGVTDESGIPLDGEWQDELSEFPSGDNIPGGEFRMLLNVVPGDINRSGVVSVSDIGLLRGPLGTSVGDLSYSALADLNGNGVVSVSDIGPLRANLGSGLPAFAAQDIQLAALALREDDQIRARGIGQPATQPDVPRDM